MMKTTTSILALCFQVFVLVAITTAAEDKTKGHWSVWGPMTPCSVTCGSGTMRMERVWVPGPDETPEAEPWTSSKIFSCTDKTFPECPRDGMWGAWGAWSGCTKPCGGGMRERHRECVGVMNGGKDCEGERYDKEDCNKDPCPPLPRNFDMSQCTEKSNFTCASQKMCIPLSQKCDSTVQCHDGSDEEECPREADWGNVRYDLSRRNDGVRSMFSAVTVAAASFVTLIAMVILH